MFHYNYVIFNWLFSKDAIIEDDYYAICVRDLENRDDMIVNHYPLQGRSNLLRRLYKIHHCRLFKNKFWDLFTSIWFPYIFKNTFINDKPICFVCIRYPEVEYLLFLKKKYPNCKVVVLCRDVLERHISRYKDYLGKKVCDIWMSFDETECKKFGFPHFDEFESKINVPLSSNYPIADVFFAGRSKGRMNKLINIYDKLTENGVACLFFILDASSDEIVERDGIRYINKPLSYTEMLRLSVNSKCILEINQEGAVGYTSRFLEAVMFNKKLITDNESIIRTDFYDPQYMLYIKDLDDLKVDFVNNSVVVDYKYNGEFSPLNRIKDIDKLLQKS